MRRGELVKAPSMRQTTRTRRGRARAAFVMASSAVALVACGDEGTASGDARGPLVQGAVEFEVTSARHVRTEVDYAQTPPVGGDHLGVWQNCGIYDRPIFEETAVHSLEHGAVWITHDPEMAPDQVAALGDLLDGRTYVLLSPFDGLPSPIVASAWGVQLAVEDPKDPRLVEFLDAYVQGPTTPEPGAPCTNGYDQPA